LNCKTPDGQIVNADLTTARWVRTHGRRLVKFRVKSLGQINDPNNPPQSEEDVKFVPYIRDYTVRFTSRKRATVKIEVRVPRCGQRWVLTFHPFKPRSPRWFG
jgi:hypothetical protein